VGYYHAYPNHYLSSYAYAGCGFYSSGYYLRFGPYRRSYFSTCSGIGVHAYGRHHCHREPCVTHGYHHYHVRDCRRCYPDGEPYAYHDVDVPSEYASAEVYETLDTSAVTPAATGAAEGSLTPAIDRSGPAPQAEARRLNPQEAFFASLKPAQLSFAFGLLKLGDANYEEASEEFFNASIEDPESPVTKVFMGLALFSTGEYRYAARYLRSGLEQLPEFPTYDWDLAKVYRSEENLDAHMKLLREKVALQPSDEDAAFVLAVLEYHRGNPEDAGPRFALLRTFAEDPGTRVVVGRYIAEIERRQDGTSQAAERTPALLSDAELLSNPGAFSAADSPSEGGVPVAAGPGLRAFLADPSFASVKQLSIR